MMNLVDYGSDSSDNEEMDSIQNEQNNDSDDAWDGPSKGKSVQIPIISKLPEVSKISKSINKEEDDMEDFLKSRKDWEKDLAEKAKTEKNVKPKKRINAFGELGSLLNKPLDDFEDEQEEDDKSFVPSEPKKSNTNSAAGSGLLKLLPQPNSKNKATKIKSVLLPSVFTQPAKRTHPVEKASVPAKKKELDSDEEDDEGGSQDFFGFNSAKIDVPAMPISKTTEFLPQAQIYGDEVMPGPSKPNYEELDDVAPIKSKKINDQLAQKLIYDKELAPWGASDSAAREAVLNIREISVDAELGPNVRETLLKNLNNKALAQASAVPLPGIKKAPQDRLAKQKHQITHLAQMAVAREEQLQEQWAENKAKRVSTAKRYGFR